MLNNQPWTREEDNQLLKEISLDTDPTEISIKHQRSLKVINDRIRKIISAGTNLDLLYNEINTVSPKMKKDKQLLDEKRKLGENTGLLWTKEEDEKLLNELALNINIKDISHNHKRNIGGIKARIKKIAVDMHEKNIPINVITDKTKLSELEINNIVNKITQKNNRLMVLKYYLAYKQGNINIGEISNKTNINTETIQSIFSEHEYYLKRKSNKTTNNTFVSSLIVEQNSLPKYISDINDKIIKMDNRMNEIEQKLDKVLEIVTEILNK